MPKKNNNKGPSKKELNKSVQKKEKVDQVPHSLSKIKQKVSINSQNFVMCKVGEFDEHYVIDGKLGQGCFGTVYKVKHRRLKIQRALKIIKKRINGTFSSFDEIQVLKKLDHSNILKIYQFYQSSQDYYIITEIFDGKQLFDVISQQDKLTEKDAANIMRQILRAVNYSHSLKISHRDIKPENILVKKIKGNFKIKIIDWGLGALMGQQNSNRICGTPQYCAPEVLKGSHNLSCDLWSIGAITYVMLTGQMPFSGNNTQQTINRVKKGIFSVNSSAFKILSAEAKSFIISLMNRDQQKRLTASKALQHAWIQKFANKQAEPVFLKQTLQRLKQFKHTSRFGIAVVSFINNHLSQQKEKEHLQQIFKHLDKDNNGVLSFDELVQGYTSIYGKQLGKQIALETFTKLDINHNQSLEFSQFVTFGLKLHKQQKEIKLREAFDLFDRDKNGKISIQEISQVLKGKVDAQLEQQIKEIIHQIDENGDEQIDINEFINCIQKMTHNKVQNEIKKPASQIKQPQKIQKITIKPVKQKIKEVQTKQPIVKRLLRSNSKHLG